MYIPFPRRVKYGYAGAFAALLGIVLLAEGNPRTLCVIVAAQVMVTAIGFNLGNGLHGPTGAYVFFVTMFTGMLGTFIKAGLNQPLLENVPNAGETLLIYLLGTCAMVIAVKLSRSLVPRKPFLEGILTQGNTSQVVAGCFVLAFVLPVFLARVVNNGGILSLLRQLNLAAPLAILIGVYQRVRYTNGRSSFTPLVFIIWLTITVDGVFAFSKEEMLFPSFAWVLAAAAARLRITIPQAIATSTALVVAMLFLVPYSQYGRNFRGQDASLTINMLMHPIETREKAEAVLATADSDPYHWFRNRLGIFDRLTLLPIDSALIERTDNVGKVGLRNVFIYLENILPHFLVPDKPGIRSGNEYAHELGLLADEDLTTGVSFSPYAEAYHLAGWWGVLLVMPALQFMLFVVIEWAAGSIDRTPWALFYIVQFGHQAAEGSLIAPVYILSAGTEALIATAFAMVYLAPVIGALIVGPEKARLQRQSSQAAPFRA